MRAGDRVACPGRGRALAIRGFCASWPGPVREPAGELCARDFPIVELPGMIGKARALCRQCRPSPMLGRSPTAGATGKAAVTVEPPSSSGLGHRPFKAAARVRIPLGVQLAAASTAWSCRAARSARHPVKVEVAGSNPVRTAWSA